MFLPYCTKDTLHVLSERNKRDTFCFQEKKSTLSTLVEKMPHYGEEIAKSRRRLFNSNIKDCLGNRPFYLKALFQSSNSWELIITQVFR